MASSPDNLSMALFCDFENVALGVRDAQYDKFDIKPVLERLLLKGSIVVKKAYCDWDRYKGFKSKMHEANFELIEIPHVRQSGKNSADIRLVVDALDLCYTKSHVNTFVIISGDSDFSPLVSKLRENAKTVIGVGVKQSTSDLLIANCDEFIFYDDLVREIQRAADQRAAHTASRRKPGDDKPRSKDDIEARRTQAVELAAETFDALMAERGDSGKIWASVLKEAIKRRRPDFSESYFGFRAFGNLLEEAQARGLMSFGRDEKSGAYVYRASGMAPIDSEQLAQTADSLTFDPAHEDQPEVAPQRGGRRRDGSSSRQGSSSRERSSSRNGASSRDASGSREESGLREELAPREERDLREESGSHEGSESRETSATHGASGTREAPASREGSSDSRRRGRQPRAGARRTDADASRDPVAENVPTAPFVVPAQIEAAYEAEFEPTPAVSAFDPHAPENTSPATPVDNEADETDTAPRAKRAARAGRTTRKPRTAKATTAADPVADSDAGTPSAAVGASALSEPAEAAPSAARESDAAETPKPTARKTASRARRPRKTPAPTDAE